MREKVLKAAVQLLADHGLRKLTQPRVAKKANVRQSHLTYYFPRRSDLIAAVARRYVESTAVEIMQLFQSADGEDLGQLLAALAYKQVGDRRRARTLMGLLVATEEDSALRAQMVQAVRSLRSVIGQALGVEEGDPRVTVLQATLWGLGVNNLLMGDSEGETDLKVLIDVLSEQTGMRPPKKKKQRGKKS